MNKLNFPKKTEKTELLLLLLFISLSLTGLFLLQTNPSAFRLYIREDGFIEYTTALLLLAAAVNCFLRGLKAPGKRAAFFFFAAALVFLFGGGEEISWGQRIFGYATPEGLSEINTQKEFNLHNIRLYGVKLNKLIFGTILYGSVFTYFLLFPILFKHNRRFRKLVNTYHFPIARPLHSIVYFLSFLLLLSVPKSYRQWELQEFALSGFILLSFLYPQNPVAGRERKSKEWSIIAKSSRTGLSPRPRLNLTDRPAIRIKSKRQKRNRKA